MELHGHDVGGDLVDVVLLLDAASSTFPTALTNAHAITVPPEVMIVSGPVRPPPFSHKLHTTADDWASECPAVRLVEPIRILPGRSIPIVGDAEKEVFL